MYTHAIIGDVHSNASALAFAIATIEQNAPEAKLVLLGDLFDACPGHNGDALQVYELVRKLQATKGAIILQSNHQYALFRELHGYSISPHAKACLESTLADLQSVNKAELGLWLASMPFGFTFTSKGFMYKAAHAYYAHGMNELKPSRYARLKALYGPQSDGKRKKWWTTGREPGQTYCRVAGHYKQVLNLPHALLLDASKQGKIAIALINGNQRGLHVC